MARPDELCLASRIVPPSERGGLQRGGSWLCYHHPHHCPYPREGEEFCAGSLTTYPDGVRPWLGNAHVAATAQRGEKTP